MVKRFKDRRGSTLAEIMVAIVLVSVMIVMVVSFTQYMTQRTKINAANDAVLQDRLKAESVLEGWVDILVSKGAAFEVGETPEGEPDPSYITATVDGEEYILRFANGYVTGALPEDGELSVRAETVVSAEFEIMHNEENGDFLLFCTVVSENEHSGETLSCTFCVNPRVGETAGAQ